MVAKIGLTGGIGSGKSSVAKCFDELGIYTIDADQVSRQLMTPGTPCYESIKAHFGGSILFPSGEINRKSLGELVFSDPTQREFLETLLHPAIRTTMHELVEKNAGLYGIMEIPLLIEGSQHTKMDRVLLVTCNTATRTERLTSSRNMSLEMIEKVMKSQLDDQEKKKYADDIINNNGTMDQLRKDVTNLHQTYLTLFS